MVPSINPDWICISIGIGIGVRLPRTNVLISKVHAIHFRELQLVLTFGNIEQIHAVGVGCGFTEFGAIFLVDFDNHSGDTFIKTTTYCVDFGVVMVVIFSDTTFDPTDFAWRMLIAGINIGFMLVTGKIEVISHAISIGV